MTEEGPAKSRVGGGAGGGAQQGVGALAPGEAAVRERTGRGLQEWFALLDGWGARGCSHAEIARHLSGEHGVQGWWAQSVTVAYEQARGLRAPGQRGDGSFSVSASRTVAVPVERLFAAFSDEGLRELWLPGADVAVRTATAPASWRADWVADSSRVVAAFRARGEGKAVVAVQHEKLADARAAARMKTHWRERLGVLKELLEQR